MEITELSIDGYERVVRAKDPESGLHAIISVHDTTLGPALGGMRMWPYASEDEALTDVLRLSRGMTFKSAIAHTGLGGGKSVILGDPSIKSEALFLAMGRFVDSLDGLYVTAEDMNIGVSDLETVRRATRHVTGLSRDDGGSGNPSPYTAYGVFLGLKAACGRAFGSEDITGKKVAVQGVGATGSALVERLVKDGAIVSVTDRNEERVQALVDAHGVQAVGADEIYDVDMDVFAPCAMGAVVNDDTIGRLKCKAIAGVANNVLAEPQHGRELFEKKVVYAPDYVINAGGIVNVSVEFREGGYDEGVAVERIQRIPEALREVWQISDSEKIPTSDAADRLAQQIVERSRSA
ncbi:MAG: Glu/Leu/Phe/Val dehydrogenase dimerization domain-containing protein [Planctomycetota bacterium]